jgi:hypothetical protein
MSSATKTEAPAPHVIRPYVSKAIAFLAADGKTVDMLPLQVIPLPDGSTVIRIGNNTLWFEADGTFDGNECKNISMKVDSPEAREIMARFAESKAYDGKAPEEPYFHPGCIGHEAETAGWPKPTGDN